MRVVSQSWKAAVTNPKLFQLRRELGTTEEWLYLLTKVDDDKLSWHALYPLSGKWQRLPPMHMVDFGKESRKGFLGFQMRNVMGSSIKLADVIRGWLGWNDACDRVLLSGCAVGAVDGCIYVLGGFSRALTAKNVWRYDPCVNLWEEVSSMTVGRAFCKTGILNNKLYVAGGVSRERGSFVPLCSAEVFDPYTGQWTQLPSMPFSKATHLPTLFLADMLKPMATGMTAYEGRLCVPQSLYNWPFFIDIGGEVYNPDMDSWSEMPIGMGDGWPAMQAGTKLGTVVNGKLYALEPSTSLNSGVIKVYDGGDDAWNDVTPKVPLRDLISEAEFPYLLAGILGKLHVITKDNGDTILLLQADFENNICPSSSPSTSSSTPANPPSEKPGCLTVEGANFWKVIVAKKFGSADLVHCQVLDL